MPSFSIQNYGEDYVNIRIKPTSPYTAYRVFIRYADDPDSKVYDEWWYPFSSRFDAYVDGLEPDTEYLVNVDYNTSPVAAGNWLGAQYFTTEGSGGGGGGGPYYVTLRFSANGGSGAPGTIEGETENDDQHVELRIPRDEPTRDGYVFLGWALDDPSATRPEYYPGDYIKLWGYEEGETYRVYAIWEEEETSGGAWVWDGAWYTATPWVYDGAWTTSSAWVWNGSWRQGV